MQTLLGLKKEDSPVPHCPMLPHWLQCLASTRKRPAISCSVSGGRSAHSNNQSWQDEGSSPQNTKPQRTLVEEPERTVALPVGSVNGARLLLTTSARCQTRPSTLTPFPRAAQQMANFLILLPLLLPSFCGPCLCVRAST